MGQGLDSSRPATVVVPFAAGGTTDMLARAIADKLREQRPVVIDNKPGGGGHIGWSSVAMAPPDGKTVLLDYRFKESASMRTAAYLGVSPLVLVASNVSGIRSVAELTAGAKKNPGRFAFASLGSGSVQGSAMNKLQEKLGVSLTEIPYKGPAPALADLAGGQVHVAFVTLAEAQDLEKSGRGRILGISSPQRLDYAPAIPTLAEGGAKGFDYQMHYRLMVPANAPHSVDAQWQKLVSSALGQQDTQDKLKKLGFRPDGSGTGGNQPCPRGEKECKNGSCIPEKDQCP
jgi:tripartite-type tricarboxylate transporter receptor subunit TctC